MSYLVIARKWRPQTFSDIAGQEPITRTLQNAIRTNRIAHAFLFTGVRGVGKTTAARVLAKALNCAKGPTPDPCNACTSCQEISQGSSIDVLEIDGASNRGIDEIRQIIENVRYQPANSRFKIYIIDEVHQVTKDAFNALLKTLEEPPPSVKFVLATTEPQRLPATILSRCQRYDFRRINLREIVERLNVIAKSEGLNITEGALVLLAREADGSMRDAQSLLEQVLAVGEGGANQVRHAAVDETLLQEVLGLAERRVLYEISAAVLDGNARRCIELVAAVVNQGRDINRLSRDLVEHFRNLLVAHLMTKEHTGSSGNAARESVLAPLLDLPDQEIADLSDQCAATSVETLLDYFDFISQGDEEINRSTTPRFALESLLVRLAALPTTLPVSQLIERLERLESKAPVGLGGDSSVTRVKPLRETAAAPVAAHREPPPGRPTDRWSEFVAFVGREKKFLASHLDASKALEMPPQRLRVGVSERHHLAFLLDGDNLGALKELANRFFAQEVNVQIVNMVPEGSSTKTDAPATGTQGEERTPMVKEALRIFGGSVRTVRKDNS